MASRNIQTLKECDIYRIGDDDDLVLIEDISNVPAGRFCMHEYGIIIICTSGRVRLEYDGASIWVRKSDLFLYMANSTACRFKASPDFKCRQIWFRRSALWDMNLHSQTTLADMSYLKHHPVLHLTPSDASLIGSYFSLLCNRMSDHSNILYKDIVHSLFGTFLLEVLSVMLRSKAQHDNPQQQGKLPSIHKRHIVDKFMQVVEQSDGRIRRVDDVASQLNITPKYLSAVLKEVMNRRPTIYIHLFTMKAIERRLRFSDMTVQEISNQLNFPNSSFFGRYFKKHSGMTPLEYRAKYNSQKIVHV